MKSRKASLTVIFATVFIDLMGFGILIPILPTFASKELGISDFGIGLVIATFSLMQFLFNPFFGKLSDKIGRKPILVATLLITGISYIIFSFANSFLLLILSRILAGFGASNIGVAQAYIADITTKEDRSKGMGVIGAAFGLGFVFGPLIGGLLSGYGYAVAGYASALFSFSACAFALFVLPESLKKSGETKSKTTNYKLVDLNDFKLAFSYPTVGILIILFFIIIFSIANIYGTFALLGYKVYGFTDAQNGYQFALVGIISAIIQGGLIRKLSQKFTDAFLLAGGTFLMMVGLGFMPYGINFWGVAATVTILSMGTGILQPTILSMISKYAPDDKQGTILGLNQSVGALARVFGPLWGGIAFDFIGYEFPFLTGALFTFITFIVTITYLNKKYFRTD